MDNTSMHNNIASIRKSRGYSQIEFAEIVGITNWWLNHIESTKRKPSLSLSIKIAEKLDVTLNDIFLE